MSSSSSYEFILTSSPDGHIVAYNASTGLAITKFSGSRTPCRGLAMVGPTLIAASHVAPDTGAGSINLYNWITSSVFRKLDIPEPVAPLSATSDGVFLFAGGVSGTIHSLSLPLGDVIKSFAAHSKSVSSLVVSDDESLVVSGSEDGTIVVIPILKLVMKEDEKEEEEEEEEDSILYKWDAHFDSVTELTFGIGVCSSTLFSSSLDRSVRIWCLAKGILLSAVVFPCSIFGVAVDSTNSTLYAGGEDGLVYKGMMKVGGRKILRKGYGLVTLSKTRRHCGSIVSLVLVNQGSVVVSAADDGSVMAWNVKKQSVVAIGDNMEIISDMIVTKGTHENGFRKRNNNVDGGGNSKSHNFTSSKLCEEEMDKMMKQITELGDITDMVEQDKKRAIGMLESTLDIYENLLRIILKGGKEALEEVEEEEVKGKENN